MFFCFFNISSPPRPKDGPEEIGGKRNLTKIQSSESYFNLLRPRPNETKGGEGKYNISRILSSLCTLWVVLTKMLCNFFFWRITIFCLKNLSTPRKCAWNNSSTGADLVIQPDLVHSDTTKRSQTTRKVLLAKFRKSFFFSPDFLLYFSRLFDFCNTSLSKLADSFRLSVVKATLISLVTTPGYRLFLFGRFLPRRPFMELARLKEGNHQTIFTDCTTLFGS